MNVIAAAQPASEPFYLFGSPLWHTLLVMFAGGIVATLFGFALQRRAVRRDRKREADEKLAEQARAEEREAAARRVELARSQERDAALALEAELFKVHDGFPDLVARVGLEDAVEELYFQSKTEW